MKSRIALWAMSGVVVAVFWAAFFYPTASNIIANRPGVWALARLSCPLVLASFHYGFGVSLAWVLVTNAVTYALIGGILETLRQPSRSAQ